VPSVNSIRLVNVDFRPACSMMAGMITSPQRALVLDPQRTAPRPRLRTSDRLPWVRLSRLWSGWMDAAPWANPHRDPMAAVRLQAS
jgi:hypothetical protein